MGCVIGWMRHWIDIARVLLLLLLSITESDVNILPACYKRWLFVSWLLFYIMIELLARGWLKLYTIQQWDCVKSFKWTARLFEQILLHWFKSGSSISIYRMQ